MTSYPPLLVQQHTLIVTSTNKGWTCHRSTVNIVLPILEISFHCWAAPPALTELFSQSQTWHSKESCLCHQWQYLTTQKAVHDVTPILQFRFMWPIVCRKQCFWLRKSACICTGTESTAAVPRYVLLAQFIWQKQRGCDGGCGDRSIAFYMSFLNCWVLCTKTWSLSHFPAVKPGWQLTK